MRTSTLIHRLLTREGSLTAAELAPEIEARTDNAFQYLARLERRGLAERRYHPVTRRGEGLVSHGDTAETIVARLGVGAAALPEVRRGLTRLARGRHVEIRWRALPALPALPARGAR